MSLTQLWSIFLREAIMALQKFFAIYNTPLVGCPGRANHRPADSKSRDQHPSSEIEVLDRQGRDHVSFQSDSNSRLVMGAGSLRGGGGSSGGQQQPLSGLGEALCYCFRWQLATANVGVKPDTATVS
eukprot:scpid91877/ scgid1310/ 